MKARRIVTIKRFPIAPLVQWGFISGVVVACLPAVLCSWVLLTIASGLRTIIAGWRDFGLEILGQRLSLNLVELLNLQGILDWLYTLTGFGVFGIVLGTLLLAGLLGIFGGITMAVLGVFYNATGRVQVEVESEEGQLSQSS